MWKRSPRARRDGWAACAMARWRGLSAVFLIAACCSSRVPQVPSRLHAPTPLRSMSVGLCEDYPERSRSLASVRRDLELMRAAGVDTLRVSIGWDEIEPERGAFDFTFWDAFVRMAVDEYGLRLLPYVAYTPRWSVSKVVGDATLEGDSWRLPPDDVSGTLR